MPLTSVICLEFQVRAKTAPVVLRDRRRIIPNVSGEKIAVLSVAAFLALVALVGVLVALVAANPV